MCYASLVKHDGDSYHANTQKGIHMSDVSVVTQDEATATPAPKKRESTKAVAFSSIHVGFAKVKGIDATRAAKLNRSYIRSNFEDVCAAWPELRKSQKSNRDGNRYPTTIPANVAKMIVTRSVPARKGKK